MKVYQKNTELAQESLSFMKYPLAIDFDRHHLYNKEAFSDWTTVILFERIAWGSDIMIKAEECPYIFHLLELVNSTGLPEKTCKEALKKLISLGVVVGSAHYERDFLDSDSCTGYYELDYERIVKLLPYLLRQPWDSSDKKRYKKITKYFKSMRDSLRELAKEED
ncbi:hypothetical protein [Pontibacter litorisediminis]|uniref:hypothetical protein n=1 Tax=Pontibacter litorisediminis TaxID=1846260 RepID=UPI0023EBBF88|nr:hypothetical protein [Pontibacter litorisediminis]